jgi:hypothetical protein
VRSLCRPGRCHRCADRLPGTFSSSEVNISEILIPSSFRFSISCQFLSIIAYSRKSPVCLCISSMDRHAKFICFHSIVPSL